MSLFLSLFSFSCNTSNRQLIFNKLPTYLAVGTQMFNENNLSCLAIGQQRKPLSLMSCWEAYKQSAAAATTLSRGRWRHSLFKSLDHFVFICELAKRVCFKGFLGNPSTPHHWYCPATWNLPVLSSGSSPHHFRLVTFLRASPIVKELPFLTGILCAFLPVRYKKYLFTTLKVQVRCTWKTPQVLKHVNLVRTMKYLVATDPSNLSTIALHWPF